MNNQISMKENLKTLKGFIIKRFIVMLCFIAVGERLIYFLYNYIIFPFLKDFFWQNKIDFQYTRNGMLLGVAIYLILILFQCIIDFLPSGMSIPFQYLLSKTASFFHLDQDIFVLDQNVPESAYFWIRILIIAIIILLLLIAVTPYAISITIYTKSVSHKVEEQELALEKQRNLLLANIAHDIKTPLTSITGYSQALLDDVEESEEKKKQYINTIYKKSVKLDEMVSLFFEYTKLESKGFQLKRENINIAEVVRETVAELFMDFEEKGIIIEAEIPETPVFFLADRIQLSRAITNLLNNSLKHNQPGDTVFVKLLNEDDIEIVVADNGVQIADEIAATIFEPFAMGDKSRNSRNGSGLGLSIAYNIAKMHKGRLELNRNSTKEYTKAFIIHL